MGGALHRHSDSAVCSPGLAGQWAGLVFAPTVATHRARRHRAVASADRRGTDAILRPLDRASAVRRSHLHGQRISLGLDIPAAKSELRDGLGGPRLKMDLDTFQNV